MSGCGCASWNTGPLSASDLAQRFAGFENLTLAIGLGLALGGGRPIIRLSGSPRTLTPTGLGRIDEGDESVSEYWLREELRSNDTTIRIAQVRLNSPLELVALARVMSPAVLTGGLILQALPVFWDRVQLSRRVTAETSDAVSEHRARKTLRDEICDGLLHGDEKKVRL